MKTNQQEIHSEHADKIRNRTRRLGNNERTATTHAAVTHAVSAEDLVRSL